MIPIYRANKIDSDKWIEGYYYPEGDGTISTFNPLSEGWTDHEIDPNTLAIHFPNMIDKNGKKIFASISEDGVGGDYCEWGTMTMIGRYSMEDGAFVLICEDSKGAGFMGKKYCKKFEVIGIHKGE